MPPPTLLQRIFGFGRSDAPPAVPGPGPQLFAPYADSASVSNPFTGLGGWADKGAVARPSPWVMPLNPQELQVLFGYNGIANRVVTVVPARACRRGWTVPEMDGEDYRLRVDERCREGMTWARLYGGSVLVPVSEDDVPPEFRARPMDWLRQPIDYQRIGRVDALHVFDAIEATPVRWETDPRSMGFKLPSLWRISSPGFQVTIHASRLIHWRGSRRPPSQIRGTNGSPTGMPDDSCLQVIWDEVRRLTETLSGGATMAQELRESVLKIGQLSALGTSDAAAALDARLSLMSRVRGLLGVTLVGKDDDFQSRSNPPTGFSELSAGAWEALAAVTGIPQVILMGATPGGLNTDGASSWQGFHQLVSTYQEDQRHELQSLYKVLYSAQDGPTKGKEPEGWALTFATLEEPDEATIAATRATVATTDDLMIKAGVYTAQDVARSRFSGAWSIDLQPVSPPEKDAADASASPFANVGLPALIQARVIGPAAARRMLGVGEDAAPTPDELAQMQAPATSAPAKPPKDGGPIEPAPTSPTIVPGS